MIFSALAEAADRGELILTEGGLCRWHCRKDGVVVIREIVVLPELRGRGVGRRMVEEVAARNPVRAIRARCPNRYTSNGFWKKMGFGLAYVDAGVNVWERDPN